MSKCLMFMFNFQSRTKEDSYNGKRFFLQFQHHNSLEENVCLPAGLAAIADADSTRAPGINYSPGAVDVAQKAKGYQQRNCPGKWLQ